MTLQRKHLAVFHGRAGAASAFCELASTSGSVGGIGLLMSMEAKSGWQSTALNHPYFLHNNGVITVPAKKYKVK